MWNKRKVRSRLTFETLENRCLLANSLVATFDGGVLRVEGTPNADQIVIQKIGSEIKVNDLGIQNAAGKTVKVPVNQVSSLSIDALHGNDLVWIKGNLGLQVELKTGSGADLVALGPATKITSSDIGSLDHKADTTTGLWKQLEVATREPQGTFTLSKLDVPSGIPGLPNVSLTNVKLKITADSIELVTGAFQLPVVGGSVTLSGAINRDGKFNLSSAPASKKIGAFTLDNFKVTVTNDKITFVGGVQHKFLGSKPIVVTGNVNPSTGTYSLQGDLPPRTLFNSSLALSNQKATLDRDGLKFEADAKLTKLGLEATFKGELTADGKYRVVGTPKGDNIAGVSVQTKDVKIEWNSDDGIKFEFPGIIEGMPPDSSGKTAKFSFSGTYGPDNWSITGKYNEPIKLGKIWLNDFTVTINKARDNRDDFLDVSCVASYLGWEVIVNVKGTARFYRDGRYIFKADGSLIDTERLSSAFGGYKVSGTTIETTNMQINQDSNGRYTINEKVKTGIVSTVVHGNFKAGGFDLSRFSGIIDSNGFYKFQSIDKVPMAWKGIDIARTTVFLEKEKGLYFTSTAGVGLYRFKVTGGLKPDGVLNLRGSTGTAGGFTLSSTSFRGDFNSNNGKYTITISGTVNTPIGIASVETKLDGSGTVPAPNIKGSVSLSGAIAKFLTGSVIVDFGKNPLGFSGNVNIKGLGISKSVSGTVAASGTLTINSITISLKDLENNNMQTIGKLYKSVGLSYLNIALSMGKNLSVLPSDLAKGLLGAGATWNEIASTLWNSSVKSLFRGGLDFSDLGIALNKAGLSNYVTLAVAVGKIGGIKLPEIGESVYAATKSWSSTASVLWSSQVKALYSKGISLGNLGYALRYAGLGSDYHAIALNIGKVGGMTLANLVTAIRGAGASWDQAAKALWYTDIDGLFKGGVSVRNLGKALSDAGLGSNYHQIALSVGRIGGMYLSDLAKAVYYSRSQASLADVAKALWYDDIDRLFGGLSVGNLITALKSVSSSLPDIAKALYNGKVFSSLAAAQAAVGIGGSGGIPNPFPKWLQL